ncbi:MAG: alpha/beta hydrolase [Mycobacterium sp.]|nr:alpha/beta hydrolase [Mycobacterium sp.]
MFGFATLATGPTLAYRDVGAGLPVLLGHGFMLDSSLFAAQTEELANRNRIITCDARGHGGTRGGGSSFTQWENARDILALMDALGIERAVLGGHSQGGYTALAASLLAPSRILGLVLIGTTSGPQDPASLPMLEEFAAAWAREGPTDELCQMLGDMVFGGTQAQQWHSVWQARRPDSFMPPFRAVVQREDLTPRLSEITAPTLIVHGEADASVPVEEARKLGGRLSATRSVVTVADAPHAVCATHSHATNQAIRTFLAELS